MNIIHALHAYGRYLVERFCWSRVAPTTKTEAGVTLTIRSRSDWDVFSEIWINKEYDGPILKAFAESTKLVFVDLGANVGLFSLRVLELSRQSELKAPLALIAVEGCKNTFAHLTTQLSQKTLENEQVQLHFGLVGKPSGSAFISAGFYSGANGVVPDHKRSRIPFRSAYAVHSEYLDMDDVLSPHDRIALIKCDIEGSEEDFIRNYQYLLARTDRVVIELHPAHCDAVACRRMLQTYGLINHRVIRETATTCLEEYSRS